MNTNRGVRMGGEQIAATGAIAAAILILREIVAQYLKIRGDSKDTERKKDKETIKRYRTLVSTYVKENEGLRSELETIKKQVQQLMKQETECQKRLTKAEERINSLEEKLQENGITFRPYNHPGSGTGIHTPIPPGDV